MTIRSRRRTNPKLHPYMFRVCDSKTPFFFLYRSISRRFPLSLSLSPKLTRALLGVSTTQSPHPGSSEGERKIYIYTYTYAVSVFLFRFFLLFPSFCARVCNGVSSNRFDSLRETRVESTIISFRYLVQTQRERDGVLFYGTKKKIRLDDARRRGCFYDGYCFEQRGIGGQDVSCSAIRGRHDSHSLEPHADYGKKNSVSRRRLVE